MRTITTLIAVGLLATAAFAKELSDSDKKWGEAVRKMIAAGPATISTPDENRAKLAKEIADKEGRESKIESNGKVYKVVVQAAKK